MFGTEQWLIFFIANIITILIFSIVYFLLKETSRIFGGTLKNNSVIYLGIIVGIMIMCVHIYVSMSIPEVNVSEGIEYFIISPSLILILIICWMIDRRLSFLLMFFQLIAMLIVFPWSELEGGIKDRNIANLVTEIIFYIILSIGFFFIHIKNNFIKNNGYKILSPFILLLFLIIVKEIILYIFLSIEIENTKSIFWVISILFGYYVLFFLLQMSTILFIERLYSNFNKLETFSVKDDVSFYKMALAQQKLRSILDGNKISIGALVLFEIKSSNSKIKDNCLRIIKEETENEYLNPFYFKATTNQYGSFFELDDKFDLKYSLLSNKFSSRDEKDSLYKISKAIEKAGKINNVEIIATSSIYGIHSNSLSELIEQCIFLTTPLVLRANISNLVVYDFSRVKHRLKERSKVLNLPFGISDMNISFIRGIGKEEIFYPEILFNIENKRISLNEMLSEGSYKDTETILRYTAYQSLRLFKKENSSIVIFYNISTFSKDFFSIDEFIKKIERYVKKENVIIGISSNKFKKTVKLKKNIEYLKKLGIKFAIINPTEFDQEGHDFILPYYILDWKVNLNPMKTNKIVIDYETDAIFLSRNIK